MSYNSYEIYSLELFRFRGFSVCTVHRTEEMVGLVFWFCNPGLFIKLKLFYVTADHWGKGEVFFY
jgi:hypothetical protein